MRSAMAGKLELLCPSMHAATLTGRALLHAGTHR